MINEVWKEVVGYEGRYWVSNMGRIKSRYRIIRGSENPDGYLVIGIREETKTKVKKIHRIVAQAFIPNPLGCPQINHKDFDKKNNCVSNLEWCTNQENTLHARLNGRVGGHRGRPVQGTDGLGNTTVVYKSAVAAAKDLGICHFNIHSAIKGVYRKKAAGYYWKFV